MAELHFRRANLDSFKERDCFLSKKPQSFVYSVASATWCASVITLDHIRHRLEEQSECLKSLTWRELAAVDFCASFAGFAC